MVIKENMEMRENTYLKFIDFIDVSNWSVQFLKWTAFSYNKNFEFVKIGDFLKRNKTQIDIENGKEYKRVTIKMNNNWVFLRDKEKWENIWTKKQFTISKWQFILSKIDARWWAFWVAWEDVDNAIITWNFWAFDVDYNKINPHFLSLITTTQEFINFSENASNGTTNRHYLQEDLFLDVKIPLPSLPEQNRIVEEYNQKLQDSINAEIKAKELEKEIEIYLMQELWIEVKDKEKRKVGLNFVDFMDIDIWWFEDTYLRKLRKSPLIHFLKKGFCLFQ
jgi:type I restriction enzyme, S subunit